MILIKNGRVVDPVTGYDGIADVLIKDDVIEEVGTDLLEKYKDATVIDATGKVVAPGLCDAHVHFRDPGFTHKEDIESGARAAACGGFTSVICMANTKPAVDNIETLEYIYEKAKKTGIRIYQTSTVTKGLMGKELVDMETMADNGACGFTDDGIPIMDEKLLCEAMIRARKLNLPISLHEEDPYFIHGAGVNDGEVAKKIGYGGASRYAEDIMVGRDVILAAYTGASVCIQHISSENSVELVRLLKRKGADVHAEATPHHIALTEDAVLKYGTNARMNPPLRLESDRLAIIEGIKDGTIDMIVTDHAPHHKDEKDKEISKAPSGIIGLETSLSVCIKYLVMSGAISLMKLIEIMSVNPLKFYRKKPVSISKGNKADIVIFAENEYRTVETFASKASNSPFIGWELPGKIYYTICDGKIVYKN